ncbi:MAG: DUF1127 domain-containing protein [Sulfitobacter sp.]
MSTLPRSAGWLPRILAARALWRSRRALSHLTPEQLADIGVTPKQAEKEAARPFWDAPDHWRA